LDFRIRQLQCFLTLSDLLNYGETARALYMSQPTITFQIKSLEEAFGAKLFERDRRQVHLTEAGHSFRGHAQAIMDTVHAARRQLSELETRLRLRVSCGPAGQHLLLPEVIRAIVAHHPNVEIEVKELSTEQQLTHLVARHVDALLMTCELPIPGSKFEALYTDSLVALVPESSPLAQRDSVSLHDLARHRILAARPQDCRFHQPVLRSLLVPFGITPRFLEAPQSPAVQFAYVAAGAGVAIASRSTARCNFPGVVDVPILEPLPAVQLGLTSMHKNPSPAMAIFRKIVADCTRRVLTAEFAVERSRLRPNPSDVIAFPTLRSAI
jgi:DNA-binding transcriptional LysR family regulator